MNAASPSEIAPVAATAAPAQYVTAQDCARLCHILELAFAHPGEDGHDYFCKDETEDAFLRVYENLLRSDDGLQHRGMAAARRFFSGLRGMNYEEVETAHIGLFTNNYPHLPCPPYGSLFTAADSDKRLQEMLAIKEFYQRHGADIAASFDDLPDHLCVELEFLHLLCFREAEAAEREDRDVLAGVRAAQREFMDRFLLPFVERLADIALASVPENPYSDLLDAARCLLLARRRAVDAPVAPPTATLGR